MVRKIFDKETLLQIFHKIILNSKFIVKSILDPVDNFSRKFSKALMGQENVESGSSKSRNS